MQTFTNAEWDRVRAELGPVGPTPPGANNGLAAAAGEVVGTHLAGPRKYCTVALSEVSGAEVEGGAGALLPGRRVVALPIGGTPYLGQQVLVERIRNRWVVDLADVEDGDDECEGTFTCCIYVTEGCAWVAGATVTVTGPGGFSFVGETVLLDPNPQIGPAGVCFEFDTPGDYSVTVDPPAELADRYDSVTRTFRLGCADGGTGVSLPVNPDYVQICCCPQGLTPPFWTCNTLDPVKCLLRPVPRTLNWEFGDYSGTATYHDAFDPIPAIRNSWVGCATVRVNPIDPEHPTEAHGNACDPYGKCLPLTEESDGAMWVFLKSCAVGKTGWVPGINMRSCPTVGRTCELEDFFFGAFCNHPLGEQTGTYFAAFQTALPSGYAFTWSCDPFELVFSVIGGGINQAVVGPGVTLRFFE